MRYAYPCRIARDEDEARATGREAYTVAFPDVYGANSGAWSREEALALAQDCLDVALGMYVQARRDIPAPSLPGEGELLVAVAPIVAAKLALYTAMREQGVTNVALAEQLGLQENAVRRLVDPGHRSHITSVEQALAALGRTLVLEDRAVAEYSKASAAPV